MIWMSSEQLQLIRQFIFPKQIVRIEPLNNIASRFFQSEISCGTSTFARVGEALDIQTRMTFSKLMNHFHPILSRMVVNNDDVRNEMDSLLQTAFNVDSMYASAL